MLERVRKKRVVIIVFMLQSCFCDFNRQHHSLQFVQLQKNDSYCYFFFFLETIIAALMHWHKEGWGDYARISVLKRLMRRPQTQKQKALAQHFSSVACQIKKKKKKIRSLPPSFTGDDKLLLGDVFFLLFFLSFYKKIVSKFIVCPISNSLKTFSSVHLVFFAFSHFIFSYTPIKHNQKGKKKQKRKKPNKAWNIRVKKKVVLAFIFKFTVAWMQQKNILWTSVFVFAPH